MSDQTTMSQDDRIRMVDSVRSDHRAILACVSPLLDMVQAMVGSAETLSRVDDPICNSLLKNIADGMGNVRGQVGSVMEWIGEYHNGGDGVDAVMEHGSDFAYAMLRLRRQGVSLEDEKAVRDSLRQVV